MRTPGVMLTPGDKVYTRDIFYEVETKTVLPAGAVGTIVGEKWCSGQVLVAVDLGAPVGVVHTNAVRFHETWSTEPLPPPATRFERIVDAA